MYWIVIIELWKLWCSQEEEEKDKGDEEEDDENDWMVPHGYLSDDEGVPDEEVGNSLYLNIVWKSKGKSRLELLYIYGQFYTHSLTDNAFQISVSLFTK